MGELRPSPVFLCPVRVCFRVMICDFFPVTILSGQALTGMPAGTMWITTNIQDLIVGQVPAYLIIGQGRVARHMGCYLTLLNIPFTTWHRAEPPADLTARARAATHILVLIRDGAIEPFVHEHLRDLPVVKIHFSGALATPAAVGAHPLMTFGDDLYTLEKYKSIPFVLDEGAPDMSELLPGLSNPSVRLPAAQKAKYHAMCVLAGNFSCLLWQKFFSTLTTEFHFPPGFGIPYLLQQAENIARDPASALTGPLARGDDVTLAKNIQALEGDAFQAVYKSFVDAYRKERP